MTKPKEHDAIGLVETKKGEYRELLIDTDENLYIKNNKGQIIRVTDTLAVNIAKNRVVIWHFALVKDTLDHIKAQDKTLDAVAAAMKQ